MEVWYAHNAYTHKVCSTSSFSLLEKQWQRKSRKLSFCRVQSRHHGDWIYIYVYRYIHAGIFLEGRGLMRRGMMEFANHPALHFSLPWFSIPPSACSSKTSSSSSSLYPLVSSLPPCHLFLSRNRVSPMEFSPHPIYLTSWYLFLVPLSSYLTTYFKRYVCPASVPRYYSSVFLFSFPLFASPCSDHIPFSSPFLLPSLPPST